MVALVLVESSQQAKACKGHSGPAGTDIPSLVAGNTDFVVYLLKRIKEVASRAELHPGAGSGDRGNN